jgi:hypothetical protein
MRFLRAIGAILHGFATTTLVLGAGVLIGVATAFYVVDNGSRLTVREQGPWRHWVSAASSSADPYTRAHVVREGQLPLSTAFALQFHARIDADGSPLHSSCDYAVEADALDANWWSLAVFDEKGRLIKNDAERWSFNSATAARGSDGSLAVTLARSARPGNWLPTPNAGRLTLVLTVLDQRWPQQAPEDQSKLLPSIRKVGC